jgi:hypothetical protein
VQWNNFLDNTDGNLSINGGLQFGRINNNWFAQGADFVYDGMVLAWQPWFVPGAQFGSWIGTEIDRNEIDGCASGRCRGLDGQSRWQCNSLTDSYMGQGIMLGSHPWSPGDGPVAGFNLHDNVIRRLNRGIQIDTAGYPGVSTVIAANNISMTPPGRFRLCIDEIARPTTSIGWCEVPNRTFCPVPEVSRSSLAGLTTSNATDVMGSPSLRLHFGSP